MWGDEIVLYLKKKLHTFVLKKARLIYFKKDLEYSGLRPDTSSFVFYIIEKQNNKKIVD